MEQLSNINILNNFKDPRNKPLGFFTFKETKMLDRANIQPMPSHVILTPEQKIALIRAKVERAESQLKALAELAKKLKER